MGRPNQIGANAASEVVQNRSAIDDGFVQRQKVTVVTPATDKNFTLGAGLDQIGQRNHVIGVKFGKAGDRMAGIRAIGLDAVAVSGRFVHQIPTINHIFNRCMAIHPSHHLGPGTRDIGIVCLQRGIGGSVCQSPPSGVADADVLGIAAAIGDGQLIAICGSGGQKPLHLWMQGAICVE